MASHVPSLSLDKLNLICKTFCSSPYLYYITRQKVDLNIYKDIIFYVATLPGASNIKSEELYTINIQFRGCHLCFISRSIIVTSNGCIALNG